MNKPIEDFTVRFNKALLSQAVKPVELSERTGLSRSTISHYMSGYTKPKSDKLYILAKALDVNEAWLMGYDVPMERNKSEDQNILRFDAELESAWNIIEEAGYSLSFSDPPNDSILTVIDKKQNIVACMHDYELVNKYESMRRIKNSSITAESLLFNDKETQHIIDKTFAFDCQLKALGWTYKIMFGPDSTNREHGIATAVFKNKDISFKASMEDCDSFINDAEIFYKERLQLLLKKSMKQMFMDNKSSILNAAREDSAGATEEQKKHADDIMMDDSEWE